MAPGTANGLNRAQQEAKHRWIFEMRKIEDRKISHAREQDKLRQRLLHLRDESSRLCNYRRMVDNELYAEAHPLGKYACRKFCQMFHATCPRELRDMVYTYIAVETDFKVRPMEGCPWELAKLGKFFPETVLAREFFGRQHIWDEEWVGKEILQELVEFWYSTSFFDFGSAYDRFSAMHDYKTYGDPVLGYPPAEFIKSIGISLNRYEILRGNRWITEIGLENLFLFKPGANIRIDIQWVMDEWTDPRKYDFGVNHHHPEMYACVDVLVPIVTRLRREGYRVEVLFGRHRSIDSKTDEMSTDAWMKKLLGPDKTADLGEERNVAKILAQNY